MTNHPIVTGLQVRTGARQSIPSNSIDSCAGVTATLPSDADGHTKRPRSRRFENRHAPWPSHQIILIRSPDFILFDIPFQLCDGRVSLAPVSRASPPRPRRRPPGRNPPLRRRRSARIAQAAGLDVRCGRLPADDAGPADGAGRGIVRAVRGPGGAVAGQGSPTIIGFPREGGRR